MTCTSYARGLFLDQDNVEDVIDELAKKHKTSSREDLEGLAREAIVLHNRATSIEMKLDGGIVGYYENGSQYQTAIVDGVDIDAKGQITFTTVDADIDFRFKEVNGKIVGNVQSVDIEGAIHRSPRFEGDLSTLFNMETDSSAADKAFGNAQKVTSGDLVAIQTEMAELDKSSSTTTYDLEHSKKLRLLTAKMSKLVKEVGNLKIDVSSEMFAELVEPIGSFNSRRKGNKIRVATADIKEQAKNRFVMGNEEAVVHETVHAYMYVLFNKQLGVIGQDIKDDLRKLYSLAKKSMTYKDLLPVGEGPYSKEEVEKAQSMYDYIFTGKLDDFSAHEADIRLQEFLAYGLTNKHMQEALGKVVISYKATKIPDGASWLGQLFYTMLNKLQKFVFDYSHKKGRNADVEAELMRLAIKLGEVNSVYGSNASARSGFVKLDENISEKFDKATSKADEAIQSTVKGILTKLKVIDDENQTSGKLKEADQERVEKLFRYVNKELNAARTSGVLGKTWHIMKTLPAITRLYSAIADVDNDTYLKIRLELDYVLEKVYGRYYEFLKDVIADFTAGRKTLVEITDITMKFKSHLDRMRDMHFKGTLKDIQSGFTNLDIYAAKNLKYNHALNKVIMRTDFQSVGLSADMLKTYLTNTTKLDAEISKLEDKIGNVTQSGQVIGKRMVSEAKEIASYMLTKKGLRSNANNVARNFGTEFAISEASGIVSDYNVEKVEKDIDKLISLYALQKVDPELQNTIVELIELDKDGVSKFLLISKGAQVAMRQDWEVNSKLHEMVKGQMKENSDYSKEAVFAKIDVHTERKMVDLGYRLVRSAVNDKADFTKVKYGLYVHDNVGLTRRIDGALGLQRLQVKGLLFSDKLKEEYSHLSTEDMFRHIGKAINKATRTSNTMMYPVYSIDGTIVDYRYEPKLSELEVYTGLEKRGTDLLARSFGQKNTQVYTDTNNEELIDIVMKDTAKTLNSLKDENLAKEFKDNEFVRIHATDSKLSTAELLAKKGTSETNRFADKTEGEELWGLIPPKTREYIIEQNRKADEAMGIVDPAERKELYIRKDLMNQLFGYNQAMVSNSKLIKKLPTKIQRQLMVVEKGASDIMAIAKSMVVVKLPRTIIGNIVSNAKFLWFSGIPFSKAVEYLLLSKKSLDKWHIDEKKRRKLERNIDTLEGNAKSAAKKEYAELAIEMQSNPLMPLIEEGLYQTIVEDINLEEDSNRIVNWAETKLADTVVGENKLINEVVNTVFLTRKSILGKALLQITQESDFHFRAAIYWHAVENGKAQKNALREVTDNFINYSKVINSSTVEWLDRMGPEAFWKYFSNIQRVNLNLIKKNTTKVVIDTVGKEYLSIPNDVLDSSIVFQWSKRLNPFNWLNNTTNLIDGAVDVPISHLIDGY